jgi:hypothetical protein
VAANLCVRRPLDGKGIRGVEVVADKDAYTYYIINIISQRQYSVARCFGPCVDNVFGLHIQRVY